jgi:hypothetical protein
MIVKYLFQLKPPTQPNTFHPASIPPLPLASPPSSISDIAQLTTHNKATQHNMQTRTLVACGWAQWVAAWLGGEADGVRQDGGEEGRTRGWDDQEE